MIVDVTSRTDGTTYANDFTAAVKIVQPKHWLETLCKLDPKFGYYLEAATIMADCCERECYPWTQDVIRTHKTS